MNYYLSLIIIYYHREHREHRGIQSNNDYYIQVFSVPSVVKDL